MTDPDESIEEQLREIAEDTFLATLDPDDRDVLIEQLNARIDGRVSPYDLFGLVLVMLDQRPACMLASERRAVSLQTARALAEDPDRATKWDPLGQFLDSHDIPFTLFARYTDKHAIAPAVVNLNYYVSLDEDRLQEFDTAEMTHPALDGPSRAVERRTGEFLGYPDAAIEAYCDMDHMREGHLLETIADDELEDALGIFTDVYDRLDLDYRAFTKFLLPYVVPSTAPECLDRIVLDVTRSYFGWLVSSEEYGCTIFRQVLADYNERFAPDAA